MKTTNLSLAMILAACFSIGALSARKAVLEGGHNPVAEQTQGQGSATQQPNSPRINKQVLRDWLASVERRVKDGSLDLNRTAEIVITADREPDGTLTDSNVVLKEGDPALVDIATDFVRALGDSRVLTYAKDATQIRLATRSDAANVTSRLELEVGSESKAKELASAYEVFLTFGAISKKGQLEETIFKAARVTSERTQIVVNFAMPRETAAGIFNRQGAQAPAGTSN